MHPAPISSNSKDAEGRIREFVRRLEVPPDHVLRKLFMDEMYEIERQRRDIARQLHQIKMRSDAAMTRIFLSAAENPANPRISMIERALKGEV